MTSLRFVCILQTRIWKTEKNTDFEWFWAITFSQNTVIKKPYFWEKTLIPCRCPENFKSIWVVVHTQMAFKVRKFMKLIIIILGFAGQSNWKWKIVGIQNVFGPSFEKMLKMSQKHDFWRIKQNTPARIAWSAFFDI